MDIDKKYKLWLKFAKVLGLELKTETMSGFLMLKYKEESIRLLSYRIVGDFEELLHSENK